MKNKDHCIFCKIAQGEIPSPRVYEDELVFCIKDIQPQAKHHFLIISKQHISSLEEAFTQEKEKDSKVLLGHIFKVATEIAKKEGLLPHGFRTVINTNEGGGQTVFHLHVHLLGGETLKDRFN